jgi:hypothetical protein
VLELNCQTPLDPHQPDCLFVYIAVPGSESYDQLQLLSVIGAQTLGPAPQDEAVALAAPPFTVE